MRNEESGFTLIEILVALALGAMAMAAIYTTYISQQRSYTIQQGVAEMQANLRAAMQLMLSELRMAGYDPTRSAKAAIKTVAASPASIRFTADMDKNGSISTAEADNEDITYTHDTANDKLTRLSGDGSAVEVAPNIDVVDIVFLDEDLAATTDPAAVVNVRVALVAKSNKPDPDYNASFTYEDASGTSQTIAGDGYRRMSLTAEVWCRNAAL